jgi:hypothetical protein
MYYYHQTRTINPPMPHAYHRTYACHISTGICHSGFQTKLASLRTATLPVMRLTTHSVVYEPRLTIFTAASEGQNMHHAWGRWGRKCEATLTLWCRIFFQILAHPVFKTWIIQDPNKVALWNKRHFEEEKNGDYAEFLKYSVRTFVEYLKRSIWRLAVRYDVYISR